MKPTGKVWFAELNPGMTRLGMGARLRSASEVNTTFLVKLSWLMNRTVLVHEAKVASARAAELMVVKNCMVKRYSQVVCCASGERLWL